MTTQDEEACAHGVMALADILWDMQEWDTQDLAVSRVLTGSTAASKGWCWGGRRREGMFLTQPSAKFRAPANLPVHTGHCTGLAGKEKM